jgi:hypothetical protein
MTENKSGFVDFGDLDPAIEATLSQKKQGETEADLQRPEKKREANDGRDQTDRGIQRGID